MRNKSIIQSKGEQFLPFLALLLVGCIAYAPLISQLGFYRDDWYQLWALNTIGPRGIITLFSIDRPVMGYLYAATSSLFGSSPLPWHLYSLALRLLGGIIFLALLRRLWPSQTRATFLAALLSLIYPGFLQQPNANTFSNQLFTYTVALFSIWLTIIAMQARTKRSKIIFTALSMLTALTYFLIYEYMIGLEGLRLGVIWLCVSRKNNLSKQQRVKCLIREWLPYMLLIVGFLFWRLIIFKSVRPATNVDAVVSSYLSNPRRALARLFLEGPKDLLEAILLGWFIPTYNVLASAEYRELLQGLAWAVSAVIITVSCLVLIGRRPAESNQPMQNGEWEIEGLWLGIAASASAILTVVFAGRDIRWDSGFDRYTLHATASVALLAIAFLWRFVKPPARSCIPLLLVVLSVLTHYLNSVEWRDSWANQKNFWWQMSWRAPQFEPGTVLIIEVADSIFYEDYEIWGPANLIYGVGNSKLKVVAEVLNNQTVEQVRLGVRNSRHMRVLISFARDFNRVLVATMPTVASCVHVLDGDSLELPHNANPRIQLIADFSRPDQIRAWEMPPSVPTDIFGPEPEHGWCYYYQKAGLARQRGDWEEVARLGNEAFAQGLKPRDRTEWMPFLMGYVIVGDQQAAQRVAYLIREKEPVRHRLCDEVDLTVFPTAQLAATFEELLCEFK